MASNGPGAGKVVTTALVVTGNMVGAGILALPVNLGPSGLIPALIGTVFMWFMMTCTALIYSRQKALIDDPDADLPTFFGRELGPTGQWVSVAANIIILYGLLTAYLSGVASIVINLFDLPIPEWGAMVGYFVIAVLLTSFGAAVMRRGNAILMIFLWLCFAALVIMTIPNMHDGEIRLADWSFLPSGLPVLLTAFHFHNIIPTLCHTLDNDHGAVTRAIWLGTGLGLIMNVIWIVVVVLALPMTGNDGANLIQAFQQNLPATVPLAKVIGGNVFTQVSLGFAVVAMTTSFMANGTAMQSFMRDLVSTYLHSSNRTLVWALSFLPPLAVGILYPNVFLSALNVAGGVGINILFGILPGVLLIKYAGDAGWKRIAGWAMIAVFGAVLLIEVGQEAGLLHISPDVEYWTAKHIQ